MEKIIAITTMFICLFLAKQERPLIIAWIHYCLSVVFTIKTIFKHRNNPKITKKLGLQLALVSLYMIWVINVIWQCNKKKKSCKNFTNIFIKPVQSHQFIYFVPLCLGIIWKLYIVLEQKTKLNEQLLFIQQCNLLQSKSQIFITFYFMIQRTIKTMQHLIIRHSQFKLQTIIVEMAKITLIICYVEIKYEYSRNMRQAFWKMHLLMDKISKMVRLRNQYHICHAYLVQLKRVTRRWAIILAGNRQKLHQEPNHTHHKYIQGIGSYFDDI